MNIVNASKKALIFGASGLIGSHLLMLLLEDSTYSQVVCFVRKNLDIKHAKLTVEVIDFDQLDNSTSLFNGDDLFICMGTTMDKAGTKEAFRKVDYEYVTKIASIASEHRVNQLLLISSIGADANSMFFYTRTKGEVEEVVKKLNFSVIHFFRPSVLLGMRDYERAGEEFVGLIGKKFTSFFGFLLPKSFDKYKPIEAKDVAMSMLEYSKQTKKGFFVHEHEEIVSVIN